MPDLQQNEVQTNSNFESDKSQQSSHIFHLAELALQEANVGNLEYKNNLELQERQMKILASLPENIIEILTAHLKSTHIEQLKYPNSKPDSNFDKNTLKGEIFEKLIMAEDDLFDLDQNSSEHPQNEEQKMVAGQLLALMSNPQRYNFEQHATRNPDLVKIIFEKGIFYIGSCMEVKTHLDVRSLEQLINFKKSFKSTIDKVNSLENVKDHGLTNLGINGHQLNISDGYYQVLAVPRNVSLSDEKEKTSFIDNRMPPSQRGRLISLLNDESLIKITRSSFSTTEINALTRYFLNEVNKMLDNEAESSSN